jgi:hypothetical protein
MKMEWRVTLGAAVFLVGIFLLYLFTSEEATGSVMLFFGGSAYTLLFGFIFLQYWRRNKIPRPEDNPQGKSEDAVGEIAYFPGASIWPVGLGLGFVFVAVGLVYGAWFFAIGGILMVGAVIGYNVEAEGK